MSDKAWGNKLIPAVVVEFASIPFAVNQRFLELFRLWNFFVFEILETGTKSTAWLYGKRLSDQKVDFRPKKSDAINTDLTRMRDASR